MAAPMDVTIQESKFTNCAEYEITAPGMQLSAHKAFFSIPAKIVMTESDNPIATLQGHFSFLRSRFDFQFADGRDYQFECEKLMKQVYVCQREGENYRLVQHHGLRWSVFQNQQQIAAIEKNRLVLGNGNQYEISMNHDAPVEVIVSMVLALNTSDGDDNNNETFTIDFGSIGPQECPYDPT
jgi:hypothetical protein